MKMINYKIEDINDLLTVFYNGETTVNEECELRQYFENENVPPELQQEKAFFLSIFESSDEVIVPQSLEYQISRALDRLDFEKKKSTVSNKKSWAWLSGIAASIALIFSVGIYHFNQNGNVNFAQNQQITESKLSETDKHKIREAEAALIRISSKFNKGINQLAMVDMNLETMNKNLNKIDIITSKFNN
jgi:hypothetical protein